MLALLVLASCADDGDTPTADSVTPSTNRAASTTDSTDDGTTSVTDSLAPSTTHAASADDSSVLTVGVAAPGPGGLDPTKNPSGVGPVALFTYEPLIRWLSDGSLGPGLATSWHYLEGDVGRRNQDFELTLRRDARFSDGTVVNAAAVKSWLEFFANSDAVYASGMGPIESIDTVDEWTLRLHLAEPNPIVPWTLATGNQWGYVASPTALEDPSVLATETHGAGPYMLDPAQSEADSSYTLIPNPHYFDKAAVEFDMVMVKVVPSPETMLEMVTSGELDLAQGTTSTVEAVEKLEGVGVTHAMSETAGLYLLDRTGAISEPLADVRVRQALNYSIDRTAITEELVGTYGEPTSQSITKDGTDPAYRDYYGYDPDRARALLAEAGYPDGFAFGILGESQNFPWPLSEQLTKYFSAIGVTLDITRAGPGEFRQMILSGTFAAYVANQPASESMWGLYTRALRSEGGNLNQHGWSDPVIDELWLEGQGAGDPSGYWVEIGRRTVTEAVWIPVFTTPLIWYVSDGVGGVEVTAQGISNYPSTPPTDWFPQ